MMGEFELLKEALAVGANATTIGIGIMLMRHHTRLTKLETLLMVVASKLKIDARILGQQG